MRFSALLLAGIIAFPAAAADDKHPRILFVIDASASMATSWPGHGGDRMGAVRASLDALAGVLRNRKVQPEVAIRIYGDQKHPGTTDACSDTRLIRPWSPADQGDLARTLDTIKPRGAGSLTHALESAASDLGSPGPNDLVLIILDGLDFCGGDLETAIAALTLDGEGAKVHAYGFALDVTDQAEISQHVATHSVSWSSQLLQGISIVISKSLSLPLLQESVGLAPEGADLLGFDIKKLEMVGTWAKEPITVDLSRENPRITAGLGTASITATGAEDDQKQRLERVPVAPEEILRFEFFEPVSIDLSIQLLEAGWDQSPILQAAWSDAPEEGLRLVLSEEQIQGSSWFHSQNIEGAAGRISLPLPVAPMLMTLQLRRAVGLAEGVLEEIEFYSPGRKVTLGGPAEVAAGASISASWGSESYPGDLVNLVPADAPPESLGLTCKAVDGSPCDFIAPFDRCTYELRYIDGRSFEVLARRKLEVGGQTAGLLAPATVTGVETVSVRWWGPAGPLDVVTLTSINADESEYLDWASPSDGSPLKLKVPQEAGDYEIRYVVDGREVAASLQLKVEPVAVSLDVSKTVKVGERLRVAWTGPDGPDDFLVLVRRGQDLKRQLDFAYVAAGSPITMAAPDRPGPYEIQYISDHPRRVLATAKFKVVK